MYILTLSLGSIIEELIFLGHKSRLASRGRSRERVNIHVYLYRSSAKLLARARLSARGSDFALRKGSDETRSSGCTECLQQLWVAVYVILANVALLGLPRVGRQVMRQLECPIRGRAFCSTFRCDEPCAHVVTERLKIRDD